MVFKSEGEKQFATLQIGDGLKTFQAKIEGCDNPLCQCNIAHIPYGEKIRTRVIPCKINGLNGKNGEFFTCRPKSL